MSCKDSNSRLRDLFQGTLLGTLIGDAMGVYFEGMSAMDIHKEYGQITVKSLASMGRGYTDDTEMMMGLAEGLLEEPDKVNLDAIAKRFAGNYSSFRGYGANTSRILSSMQMGKNWQSAVKQNHLLGGSYGNGAAMRAAPAALAFFGSTVKVCQAAKLQSEPTGHTHPDALAGAELQAYVIHYALWRAQHALPLNSSLFIRALRNKIMLPRVYTEKLSWIADNLNAPANKVITNLGVTVRSSESVPSAIWAALSSENFDQAILKAVQLGGDTDTIGAMTGAIAGAYFGRSAIPEPWLDAVENGIKGKDYIAGLADRLFEKLQFPIELDEPQILTEI